MTDGASGPEARDQPEPRELLRQAKELRRAARKARHAYWGPLILFGLLIGLSAPIYVLGSGQAGSGGFASYGTTQVFGTICPPVMCGPVWGGAAWGYYWLVALPVGLLLTAVWYRWHARRVGLATPSAGYVITTAVLALLVIFLPMLARLTGQHWLMQTWWIWPADLVIRGTMPLLILAAGLWVLAWSERSRGMVIIALIFTGTAFLVSLYDIQNVLYRVGWNLGGSDWRLAGLPNIVLPALVLLISGTVAWVSARPAPRWPDGDARPAGSPSPSGGPGSAGSAGAPGAAAA